jgi:superoxide dismutase, Fe-Mn family
MHKRSFLKTISALTAISMVKANSLKAENNVAFSHLIPPGDTYTLPALDYSFDALEPHIDAKTMEIHHDRHHNAYITNLNKELASNAALAKMSLEQLFSKMSKQPAAIRHNGGGHYNHSLFWKLLGPAAGGEPQGSLASVINLHFKDFANFKDLMNKAGTGRFGSGWSWLVVNATGKLSIGSTPNQDNPLMDIAEIKGYPLLGIDVWEHAYYLKYQNKRADYLQAIWNVIRWDEVSKRYEEAKMKWKFK